jgi:hypothetical protein
MSLPLLIFIVASGIVGFAPGQAMVRRLAALVLLARTHNSINDSIGSPDDPVTRELFACVGAALKR